MKRPQAIRDEVLLQLAAAFPQALPVERLHRTALRAGYDFTDEEIRAAAHFLAGTNPAFVRIEREGATNQERFAATSAGVASRE
jgi:hypothetical protein